MWWFAKSLFVLSYMLEIFHNKKFIIFILRVWLRPKKGKINCWNIRIHFSVLCPAPTQGSCYCTCWWDVGETLCTHHWVPMYEIPLQRFISDAKARKSSVCPQGLTCFPLWTTWIMSPSVFPSKQPSLPEKKDQPLLCQGKAWLPLSFSSTQGSWVGHTQLRPWLEERNFYLQSLGEKLQISLH